jgi:hypothetical protein
MHQSSHALLDHSAPATATVPYDHRVAAGALQVWVGQARRCLRGPASAEIRGLLENLAKAAETYSDKIGTNARFIQDGCEFPLPYGRVVGIDFEADLAALIAAFADFGDAVRKAGDAAAASGDSEVSVLCIGTWRTIDYELWAIEAHLADQGERRRWRSSFPQPHRPRIATTFARASFQKPCNS